LSGPPPTQLFVLQDSGDRPFRFNNYHTGICSNKFHIGWVDCNKVLYDAKSYIGSLVGKTKDFRELKL
jgi:hypothetical protein